MPADDEIRNGADQAADGDEPFVPLDPDELLAGEDAAADAEEAAPGSVAVLPGDEDLGPEFVAEAGTADIGVPDEQAADELVGDDAGAAEWGQMDVGANGHQPVVTGAGDDAEVKALEERLERLERVQQEVVRTARQREAARVRRKVVASTAGAGAASFVPILLQLVDAFHLSPELAATVSSVVAALGALVAGYLTPERPPILPPEAGTVETVPAAAGHA
jgi:hypothetical protein